MWWTLFLTIPGRLEGEPPPPPFAQGDDLDRLTEQIEAVDLLGQDLISVEFWEGPQIVLGVRAFKVRDPKRSGPYVAWVTTQARAYQGTGKTMLNAIREAVDVYRKEEPCPLIPSSWPVPS